MPRTSRGRLQLSEEEKKKRRRDQKKMSMRRARAKLDAVALEERRRKDRERYMKKKEDGLIKTIKDFTPREQRQIRKIWRNKARLRRQQEKMKRRTVEILNENTPPSSPTSMFSRVSSGKKVSARNRRLLKLKNEYLSNKLMICEKKLAKYRMRLRRLKMKQKSKVNCKIVNLKQKVHDFLVNDEQSRLTAGKKETITRRKEKKQIRLLNDTLLNLHKIFVNKSGIKISYETFRRFRPFWVIFPKAVSRNTCLCTTHANTDFVVVALKRYKVISFNSATDVARYLCCDKKLNISCLERKCLNCSNKQIELSDYNKNDTIIYQRWVVKSEVVVIKGVEKQCKKTVKENVKTTCGLLLEKLESMLPKFMQHLANIHNQFSAIQFIKQNLSPADGLLHIDFSENYGCKYGEEIQSAHFGGSKAQLSLHTCVYYSSEKEYPLNLTKSTSICTVSENTRHDPVLICAHLKPVIEKIRVISPKLTELHILSDGPSTQYRNKTMFHMIVNYITKISNVERIIWHYSESGHGKGAPDGVGGCLKRLADSSVAYGKDIYDLKSFVDCLENNCKKIIIIPIDDTEVESIKIIAQTKAFQRNSFDTSIDLEYHGT